MNRPRSVKAPTHLKPATRRWWRAVWESFELEDHHRKLLDLAATAWDRAESAREVLDREGVVYVDRFGVPRTRPEVAIERDSRLAFARLLRELRLDVHPDDERLPVLGGGRHYGA